MARYEDWREFRVALEQSLGKRMPTQCYKVAEDLLFTEGMHAPFGDCDIEDALRILSLRISYVPQLKHWLDGAKG